MRSGDPITFISPVPPPPRRLLYLWPDIFYQTSGLGHMKEIVRTLFTEAHSYGREAIIPPLFSHPEHNCGRRERLDWTNYYDWADIAHTELPSETPYTLGRFLKQTEFEVWDETMLLRTPSQSYKAVLVRTFPDSQIFGDWISPEIRDSQPTFAHDPFVARYPSRVRDLAKKALVQIGQCDGALHVRRADLVGPEVEPDRVAAHLKSCGVPVGAGFLLLPMKPKNPSP
jgi:hypothetical protein